MNTSRKVWIAFWSVVVLSFSVLGYYGYQIYVEAPPIPDRVVTPDGAVVFTGDDIRTGQEVWRSIGGHQLGSVWGHGAYVAPDWSADWLHRELVAMLDLMALEAHGRAYESLPPPEQAALRESLRLEVRTSRVEAVSGDLTISEVRAKAAAQVAAHYDALFGDDSSLDELREDYAMRKPTIADPERRAELRAFFFWTSWACAANRPGTEITYTNNWPAEGLIDNRPTSSIFMWSMISILGLLAGIGVLVWYMAAGKQEEENPVPDEDPLLGLEPTPSMLATVKYFWVVAALMVVQVVVGVITAHYGVEGQAFFGIELGKWLPYSVTRTWHVQLGIFWIATAWLATLAWAVSGRSFSLPACSSGSSFWSAPCCRR